MRQPEPTHEKCMARTVATQVFRQTNKDAKIEHAFLPKDKKRHPLLVNLLTCVAIPVYHRKEIFARRNCRGDSKIDICCKVRCLWRTDDGPPGTSVPTKVQNLAVVCRGVPSPPAIREGAETRPYIIPTGCGVNLLCKLLTFSLKNYTIKCRYFSIFLPQSLRRRRKTLAGRKAFENHEKINAGQ